MRAITVVPGKPFSAELSEIDEPDVSEGPVLVQTLAVGVCGTDSEILAGRRGSCPAGETRLVLGHESIGRILEAPGGSGLAAGDLVVPIVRRPDPVPCYSCGVGEWDECRNGRYTEHGIKQLHGFMRERYRSCPDALVSVSPALSDVGVLLEPTTIVAKAWEHIEAIGHRVTWRPSTVVVVGAGPIGLLAALLGVQRGLDVHVLDRVQVGDKPDLVRELGATYHAGTLAEVGTNPDVVIECTGVPHLVTESLAALRRGGVLCLTGTSPAGTTLAVDVGATASAMVSGNLTVFGSVNANRRHYTAAVNVLVEADRRWLGKLISRRVPIEQFRDAFEKQPGEVKVVVDVLESRHLG